MPAHRTTAGTSVYQLKVTLLGTKPPVWRRLVVPGHLDLAGLHTVLQVAMGWESALFDYHLHQFDVAGVAYGNPEYSDGWGKIPDEHLVTLGQVAVKGSRFMYWYDFGDDWRHRVGVEKVLDEGVDSAVATCADGRRACPPEDCGGVWAYEQLLAALGDPEHPDHEEMVERFGEIAPDAFDRVAVNAQLAELFAGHGGRQIAGSRRR